MTATPRMRPLVHFGPFRFYSPIDEPLDDRYPENEDGWTCMRKLALAAGDKDYVKMIDHANALKKLPFIRTDAVIKNLADALTRPQRKPLFEYIYRKVCDASSRYPERTYSSESLDEMEDARKAALRSTRSQCRSSTMRALRSGFWSWSGIRRMPARNSSLFCESLVKRNSSDRLHRGPINRHKHHLHRKA